MERVKETKEKKVGTLAAISITVLALVMALVISWTTTSYQREVVELRKINKEYKKVIDDYKAVIENVKSQIAKV